MGFDEADIATAFYTSDSDLGNILGFSVETQILFKVTFRNMILAQDAPVHIPVLHNHVGLAFDEDA